MEKRCLFPNKNGHWQKHISKKNIPSTILNYRLHGHQSGLKIIKVDYPELNRLDSRYFDFQPTLTVTLTTHAKLLVLKTTKLFWKVTLEGRESGKYCAFFSIRWLDYAAAQQFLLLLMISLFFLYHPFLAFSCSIAIMKIFLGLLVLRYNTFWFIWSIKAKLA